MKKFITVALTLMMVPLSANLCISGSMDSPGDPSLGSGMYTLADLYEYMTFGSVPSIMSGFQEPTAAPGATMKTTKEIYEAVKVNFDQCDATPNEVLNTVKFFSTDPSQWGPTTGNISLQTLSPSTVTQPTGYYNAFDLSSADPDLAAGNIKSGVTIFGVTGDTNVVDTTTGDASSTDILSGKRAWVAGAEVTGSLATQTLLDTSTSVNAGFYNSTTLDVVDSDLVSANIKSGISIFGVTGSVLESTGDATAGDVLTGRTFSNTGSSGIAGTMPNQGGINYSPGISNQAIAAGYHDGSGVVYGDLNLASGNIKSGVTIFGVTGDTTVVDTTTGDATSADILSGKKAWVSGAEVTGSITTQTLTDTSAAVNAGYYNSTTLDVVDTDLISANIRSGVNLFGVTGSVLESTGDATAGDVLTGRSFSSTGSSGIAGTMPNQGGINYSPGISNQTIVAGYHDGSGVVYGDANLASGNIKSGMSIFGVTGDTNVVDTTTGDALSTDILNGKKAWVAGTEVTGSITTQTLTDTSAAVNAGYYNSTTLDVVDSDLVSANIKSGVSLFGVTGSVLESTGDATAGDVLTGRTFSNTGSSGIAGTMPNQGGVNYTPGISNQQVAAGYHDGSGVVYGDANLASGNIKSGVTIFGVTGDTNVVDTTTGDASSTDILSGKRAWVAGAEVTGSLATQTLFDTSTSVNAGYYAATSLDVVDADLVSANVRSGVNIFGVTGSLLESTGDATAGDVLTGRTFSNTGSSGIAGTMPNQGGINYSPGISNQAIVAGYHDGSGVVYGDANLASGNIKSGVTIFGVTGDTNVVDTSTGDASSTDILSGKRAWVAGAEVTGSLATQTFLDTSTSVNAGYYNSTTLDVVDPDLVSANIKSGISIFGVTGSVLESTGDAAAGDVLTGRTFSNTGSSGIAGTMANQGGVNYTPGISSQTIAAGYHDGSGVVYGDLNLASGNIKSGVTIFGVTGDTNVVDTTTGDASSTDILSGKKAWVAGAEVTGSLATQTLLDTSTAVNGGYYNSTTLDVVDSDLVSANIKSGVSLFGVTGSVLESIGDAAAGDVLTGRTFSNAGLSGIAGTMPNQGGVNYTPGISNQQVAAGYHDGSGVVYGDANLASGNIKSGVTIFGVTGDTNVVDTTTGDASSTDILSGKKAWVAGAEVTGSLATQTLFDTSTSVNAGYYAATSLDAVDADLVSANVRSGVNIFGVTGSILESTGDATAGDVLTGRTFSNTGSSGIAGTMPNQGGVNYTPGISNQQVAAGYHDGSGVVYGDANLASGNIKSGVTIFGVTGDTNVVDTTTGDATSTDILSGKKAWVAGAEVTGSLATQTLFDTSTSVNAGYYAATSLDAVDADLVSANVRSGVNIFGVTGSVLESTGDAAAGDVLTGRTFSNAGSSGIAGTMPNQGGVNYSPGISNQAIGAGYHDGSGVVYGDANLASGNIRSGVTIFGVAGDTNVVDTTTGDAAPGDILKGRIGWVDGVEVTGTYPTAPIEKTDQTVCYDEVGTPITCTGTGQDGEYQRGVPLGSPRFTINGDGTVTDNLTGLIWLQDAGCLVDIGWLAGLTGANALENGVCGLTDGSVPGEWRLPNVKELLSLLNYRYSFPSLSNAAGNGQWVDGDAFIGVSGWYWSSTSKPDLPDYAFAVSLYNAEMRGESKTSNSLRVLAVRGGL